MPRHTSCAAAILNELGKLLAGQSWPASGSRYSRLARFSRSLDFGILVSVKGRTHASAIIIAIVAAEGI
jgi:hypothetical protein